MAALRLIQQQSPDLVIADIMMPNLDGIAFLKEIRSHSKSRALPVLLLSARAGEDARIEGLQAGADDYLSKPFSARELLARVEAQLQLSQLRQETQATIDNIVESIADPFYVLDHGWHFLYVNQAAQQMLGKTREELIGKHISEVFLQGLGNRVYEIMQSAVVSQRPAAFEAFSSFLNRWFDINIYPGSRGIAIYFKEATNRSREK
jgi:PAS domain S-box-containing protein